LAGSGAEAVEAAGLADSAVGEAAAAAHPADGRFTRKKEKRKRGRHRTKKF
jgi:hypothetical protein